MLYGGFTSPSFCIKYDLTLTKNSEVKSENNNNNAKESKHSECPG
jgi:hypothetical protein